MSEREQRGALLVPVAPPLIVGLMRDRVAIDHRYLADGTRPGKWQLSARSDITEDQIGDRCTPLSAGIPNVEDRRDIVGGPPQVERATVHDQQHDGRTGGR